VLVMGDYYLAHTAQSVTFPPSRTRDTPGWALDGSSGGSGHAKLISFLGTAKQRDDVGYDLAVHYAACAEATATMAASVEPLAEVESVDDAEVVVVAFGTPGKYVRAAVRQLRAEGSAVGFVRPVTLFPFPSATVAEAGRGARAVAVYENNQGQMVDDVRLSVLGEVPVHFIGGLSLDSSGFGIAPDLDVAVLVRRIREVAAR
jgi:2-oxoglutarate ferredoxin oxidoreductase subunit alpha